MSHAGLVFTDRDRGSDWARGSLAQGSDLALRVSSRLAEFTVALVVAPPTVALDPAILDDHGRGFRTSDVDRLAARMLDSLHEAGAKTLVVEDDLARRGDPRLPSDIALVGERVLRWIDLSLGSEVAARLLRTGASGYPLNAVVCMLPAEELALTPGRVLTDDETLRLASTARAVITSVYDAETYLILTSAKLAAEINRSGRWRLEDRRP